jgi:hypothetical protein
MNPQDGGNFPNPGTGSGDPRLAAALLPRPAGDRFDPPGAVVAMPDTDRRSLFIGLRQFSTPVAGAPACEGWYGGLWTEVLDRFNVRGVQLALAKVAPPGSLTFSEAIITGPPAILSSLADRAVPAECRFIAGPGEDFGGIRPLAVSRIGLASWAYKVTGPRKFPVWQWVEVIQGPGFLLEVRIPNQAPAPRQSPVTPLQRFAAAAYQQALSALT